MNRKIRYGMIGGGRGAFIGAVHRIAVELDQQIKLVCGASTSHVETPKQTATDFVLLSKRCYGRFEEKIQTEAELRDDKQMDFNSIVTPHHVPHDIRKSVVPSMSARPKCSSGIRGYCLSRDSAVSGITSSFALESVAGFLAAEDQSGGDQSPNMHATSKRGRRQSRSFFRVPTLRAVNKQALNEPLSISNSDGNGPRPPKRPDGGDDNDNSDGFPPEQPGNEARASLVALHCELRRHWVYAAALASHVGLHHLAQFLDTTSLCFVRPALVFVLFVGSIDLAISVVRPVLKKAVDAAIEARSEWCRLRAAYSH